MGEIYCRRIAGIRAEKERLEQKLNVRLRLEGKKVHVEGDSFHEYEAMLVLEAINFGFSVGTALQLTDEGIQFRRVPIKSFTRRKNLTEVRGRIIGAEGRTRRTVEQISGCEVVVRDTEVGLIGRTEDLEAATTAIINLIKGSKQANVYYYLEQSNTRKKQISDDLGIKYKKEEK